MDSREAIKASLNMAEFVSMTYLSDLSDADLFSRPHSQCNHINWQIGHLVAAENQMLDKIVAGGMPALPEGFAAKYTKETASIDDPSAFCSKEVILAAYKTQRAATLAAIDATPDEQLDAPTGLDFAPTLGVLFTLQGCHWAMHCGQWVIVRRNLGKAVVI